MKAMFVLVILSGNITSPTWTVSSPVTEDTCESMKEAINASVQEVNSVRTFVYPKPAYLQCRRLWVKDK